MFEDREKAGERKFVRDREIAFRIRARRNKLLGLWAAEHMGLLGEVAACYALDLVDAEVNEHGDCPVIRKVRDDLMARGYPMTETEVRNHVAAFEAKARAQILGEAASRAN